MRPSPGRRIAPPPVVARRGPDWQGGPVSDLGAMPDLFHAAEPEHWARAERTGEYTRSTLGMGLEQVGFVHCSFAGQLQPVLDAIFSSAPEVLLLRIDPAALTAPVRVEDLDGLGEAYPHVYGPIPVAAVREVRPLRREGQRWLADTGAEPETETAGDRP